MKSLFAAVIAFFASLLGLQSTPIPSTTDPQPPITSPTPLPTPSYPRQTYTNSTMKYSLLYPANTSITESPSTETAWDTTYTLRIDPYPQTDLSLATILDTDLMCDADGPTGSVSCKNTAVRPFTNQTGTDGFLVRRTKTISGGPHAGDYKDTAYVFPVRSSAASAVILSVELPSSDNLQILTDTANWFTALP